jgi:3'(2'), 5'-bisphosphate nucleotidase
MIVDKKFIDSLLSFGAELSKEVVQIQERGFKTTEKSDSSPLTEADLHSNKRIREFLFASTDVANIISEEDKEVSYEQRKDWDYYWMIDPIDGTKEFVKGGDDFCINIALCNGDRPVFGYVACPKKSDQYFAIEGRGAFKNGERIYAKHSINPQSNLVKVVASKSHMNEKTSEFISNLEKIYKVETLNVGSSLKFCLVAEGEAHIYPRFGPTMEWDTCAPQIIAEESGANVFVANNMSALKYNKQNLLNPFFIVAAKTFNPNN